jgi:hypothetical protein
MRSAQMGIDAVARADTERYYTINRTAEQQAEKMAVLLTKI